MMQQNEKLERLLELLTKRVESPERIAAAQHAINDKLHVAIQAHQKIFDHLAEKTSAAQSN